MKPKRSRFFVISLTLVSFATLLFSFSAVAPVFAKTYPENIEERKLLSLEEFTFGLIDGRADALRGVYVPGVFALQIESQPDEKPAYVSEDPGSATLFNNAIEYGNIGLLAHNTLSGKYFYNLQSGDEVWLVYGDGTLKHYMVTEIFHYQALDPDSVYSDFVDLSSGETVTTSSVFHSMYGGDHHITFQTCIAQDDTVSWGRLFIHAMPVIANIGFSGFMNSLSWQ